MELREDPVFGCIDPGRYGDYVRISMTDGKEKAGRYDLAAIKKCLTEHGMTPELIAGEPPMGIHSEAVFLRGTGSIRIYEQVLRELTLALGEAGMEGSFEELAALHMAHEFYHCLEYWDGEDVSRKCPEVIYRFMGVIPRKGYVRRTREIGAHTFAKEVCRLDIHPKLLDYLLLDGKDKEEADAYFKECMEWSERWKELRGVAGVMGGVTQ